MQSGGRNEDDGEGAKKAVATVTTKACVYGKTQSVKTIDDRVQKGQAAERERRSENDQERMLGQASCRQAHPPRRTPTATGGPKTS